MKRKGAQVAALPFRANDELEFLLITSRETRRWVIPKGWPMKGKKPHEAAAREALEEAGVVGRIAAEPLGAYNYRKRLAQGGDVECCVQVFPLDVVRQRRHWREQGQRTVQWFSATEAAEAVSDPQLRALIIDFSERRRGLRQSQG